MARADLLVKLVKSAKSGDKLLFNKVVESLLIHYKNAEIDKNCFVITKENLS